MGNLAGLLAELGPRWPGCMGDLTEEVAIGLLMARAFYNLDMAAKAETERVQLNTAMADAFDEVDLVICATNPGPAFPAEHTTSNPAPVIDALMGRAATRTALRGVMGSVRVVGGFAPTVPAWLLEEGAKRMPDITSMGGLTIPANVYGNPSVSIPAGFVDGLPVGMQVMARHHHDALLFDVALAMEREMPWPLTAS
jgi:aspartyl-tRNA(Asn)/glutamyl-tRNA(Gln) amidotransferase subunit A